MSGKYIVFLVPFLLSCQFSVNDDQTNKEKKYRKVESEVVGSNTVIQSSKAHKLSRKGVQLSLEGKYEEAEEVFRKALAEEPDHPTLLSNIGLTYYQRDLLNPAIEYFNRALEVSDSTNIMAATNLGLTYYHQMDYGRALEIMDYTLSRPDIDNTEKFIVRLNRLMVDIELENCEEIEKDREAIEYLRKNNKVGDYKEIISEFDEQITELCTTSVNKK